MRRRLPAHPLSSVLLPPLSFGLLALLTALAGCTTVAEPFPGLAPEDLWPAMLSAAESPAPDPGPEPDERWQVEENEVWADRDGGRLEIFRRLMRISETGSVDPLRENRQFRFQVTLVRDDPTKEEREAGVQPPWQVSVKSRGAANPGHAREAAEWYIRDLRALLGLDQVDEADEGEAPDAAVAGPGNR